MKTCLDCEIDITNRGNRAIRCNDCQEAHRRKYKKGFNDCRRERYDLKPGSKSPFKIDAEGCGNNKNHNYPQKQMVWMHYWTDKNNGEPCDMYLKARGRAIDKLNKLINKHTDEPKLKRTKKEVYKDWKYY